MTSYINTRFELSSTDRQVHVLLLILLWFTCIHPSLPQQTERERERQRQTDRQRHRERERACMYGSTTFDQSQWMNDVTEIQNPEECHQLIDFFQLCRFLLKVHNQQVGKPRKFPASLISNLCVSGNYLFISFVALPPAGWMAGEHPNKPEWPCVPGRVPAVSLSPQGGGDNPATSLFLRSLRALRAKFVPPFFRAGVRYRRPKPSV